MESKISPLDYYTEQLAIERSSLERVKRKLFLFAMLRLLTFILVGVLIYFLGDSVRLIVGIIVAWIVVFLLLVSKNADIRQERKKLEALIDLNELEIRTLNRDVKGQKDGMEYVSENHFYNQDIDLFGEGAIFQFLNRTKTVNGERRLADLLNENSISGIPDKQLAIQTLAKEVKWRQNFQTTAGLIATKIESTHILNWLVDYKQTIPKVFKFIPLIFSVLSILNFVLYGFSIVNGNVLIYNFFLGIILTGIYFKKVNALYIPSSKMTATFAQYALILKEIEKKEFAPSLLKEQQVKIQTKAKKASAILNQISKDLNSLDQRNNLVFSPIANGFFLWDLKYAVRIENWIKEYSDICMNWFEVIEFFDAYNSLANFAFNNEDYIYPKINAAGKDLIMGRGVGHPLLAAENRVVNDFDINKEDFFIITGANMAGKSTFLRTVALNIVLSNNGLPVCAKAFNYRPIKLISSMRTSDSLVNDESYFFSELKRLKFIVDEIKKDEYFIILDEILKGTNSKDKEEGSNKFVQKLVASHSTGIIATHDLSLCKLADSLPQIKNYYFDAEIVNDELYFDYTFKDGICKNMNASFLLKKMEII